MGKQLFELALAAEKQRAIAAENRAKEKIRKLEDLKSFQLIAANKSENENKILKFKLKTVKQHYEELLKSNILEKVQAEKLEAQKQLIESKLTGEKQLKIIEKEANERVRKLEIDSQRQFCDANKFEILKELQKIKADTSQTQKQIFELNLANKNKRIAELEVKFSEEQKFQLIKEKIEIQNKLELQIQKQLFESNVAVEKQRTITEIRVNDANERRSYELYKQQMENDKVKKLEMDVIEKKNEAERKVIAEQKDTAPEEKSDVSFIGSFLNKFRLF